MSKDPFGYDSAVLPPEEEQIDEVNEEDEPIENSDEDGDGSSNATEDEEATDEQSDSDEESADEQLVDDDEDVVYEINVPNKDGSFTTLELTGEETSQRLAKLIEYEQTEEVLTQYANEVQDLYVKARPVRAALELMESDPLVHYITRYRLEDPNGDPLELLQHVEQLLIDMQANQPSTEEQPYSAEQERLRKLEERIEQEDMQRQYNANLFAVRDTLLDALPSASELDDTSRVQFEQAVSEALVEVIVDVYGGRENFRTKADVEKFLKKNPISKSVSEAVILKTQKATKHLFEGNGKAPVKTNAKAKATSEQANKAKIVGEALRNATPAKKPGLKQVKGNMGRVLHNDAKPRSTSGRVTEYTQREAARNAFGM